MRIAMIGLRGIPSNYGGIERHVEASAPRLVAKGHEVTVYGRSHCAQQGVYKGVHSRTVKTLRGKHTDTTAYAMLASVDALRRRYDIIHYHGIGPSLFAAIPKCLGIPTVVTVHGLDWKRAKWGRVARMALRVGEMTSYRTPGATVVVSKTLQDHYRSLHGAATELIPNGVDLPTVTGCDLLDPSLGLSPGEYFLYVGRLVPEKGLHYLVRAFKRLNSRKKLVIVGEATHTVDYAQELRRSAEDDPRIVFAGFVEGDELQQFYANAFAFVLPSEIEGLSIALLEAMSHGLPVIASDLPENMEVIVDAECGEAGYHFQQRDAADLTRRMAELIESPAQARSVGQRARAVVERRFGWDHAVSRLERVYEGVARRRGPVKAGL